MYIRERIGHGARRSVRIPVEICSRQTRIHDSSLTRIKKEAVATIVYVDSTLWCRRCHKTTKQTRQTGSKSRCLTTRKNMSEEQVLLQCI